MQLILLTVGSVAIGVLMAERLFSLAPTRFGWLVYFANVVLETLTKKLGWSRAAGDIVLACFGFVSVAFGGLPWAWAGGGLLVLLGLEVYACRVERHLLTTAYCEPGAAHAMSERIDATMGLAQGYPAPSTHPLLTLTLAGPFVRRLPTHSLGTLVVGRELEIAVIIGNHTVFPTQTELRVRVQAPPGLTCEQVDGSAIPRLESGRVWVHVTRWKVAAAASPGSIRIAVEWDDVHRGLEIKFDGSIVADACGPVKASIGRYPGACRSAFAWRGDMDLYDESTFQSIQGLEVTFGLAARYRIPQTMYLSTRLSLDQKAADEWAAHYGVNRGAARIPDFIEWMQRNVDLRHACGYPFNSDKRFVVELGNHGHLHYGTHTSGAAENRWKLKARMGAGVYAWLTEDRSSFGEQRDNAMEAARWMERLFGFRPRSWAMPDRTNDEYTGKALEAAGCEVLSGSNTTPRSNVLLHPPPHHPKGTRAVELTNRYPGDPQHVYHWAMVTFWLHRSYRRGIPMVFMCHQHMRQFAGHACTRFTENILHQALNAFRGDVHINTMFGVGKYWKEVLSPETARVRVFYRHGQVVVENGADVDFERVPLDLRYGQEADCTWLVDAPAGHRLVFDAATGRVLVKEALSLRPVEPSFVQSSGLP